MPDGHRHTLASCVVAASAGAALFLYSPSAAFWCATGALSGVMLTPDMDVDAGNITYHYMRKYAGMPAELLWRVVWWPYAHLIPHRGFMSHGPVVSTIVRLLYLSLFIAPVWWWLKLPIPRLTVSAEWWLLGLCLSDVAHYVLDKCDELLGGRL